eukprot:COSAG04_NODE_2334_length_4311_cov_1.734093_3_plen_206_part_00
MSDGVSGRRLVEALQVAPHVHRALAAVVHDPRLDRLPAALDRLRLRSRQPLLQTGRQPHRSARGLTELKRREASHRFVVRLGRLRRLGGPAQFLLVREEAAVVRPAVAGAAQRGNLGRRELAVSCTRNIHSREQLNRTSQLELGRMRGKTAWRQQPRRGSGAPEEVQCAGRCAAEGMCGGPSRALHGLPPNAAGPQRRGDLPASS